jgi:hypothetical protein
MEWSTDFRRWICLLLALLGMHAINAQEASMSTAPVQTEAASQDATLFVLNISGPTLFASNQDITDNGKDMVSLPRSTFRRLNIAPGKHEFRFKPFPQGKRVAQLEAQPGNAYYLVVGYSPGKSWAFPVAGDPMTITLVNEETATALLKDMKEQ